MRELRVLVVDDEPDLRELLQMTLQRMDLQVVLAETVASAKQQLTKQQCHLCLTDYRLPDATGMELIQWLQEHQPHVPVALITAFGSMDLAIAAMKAGAYDFVSKPVALAQLRDLIQAGLQLSATATNKTSSDKSAFGSRVLLGQSALIQRLRQTIDKVARSLAPVHITGESGVGKELVARLIHQQSPRAIAPFLPINCGAIPENLMESELFGHKKGSFTGAVNDHDGILLTAKGGTVFLDEIADLPLNMQVKLLRAVQERAVRRIGDQKETTIDVRILSATHKNLKQMVERGFFRADLYYRINVIEIQVPSLQERREDLPLLIDHILQQQGIQYGIAKPQLTDEALSKLLEYSFPGNIRELENILERAVAMSEGCIIKSSDLQLQSAGQIAQLSRQERMSDPRLSPEQRSAAVKPVSSADASNLPDYLGELEKNRIIEALQQTRWNKTKAAKLLGITLRALRYRLEKLGLDQDSVQ